MDGDDAKKVILARRARFIAAALTGLVIPGCGKTTGPVDSGSETTTSNDAGNPMPCLSIAAPQLVPDTPPPIDDAAPPPSKDAGARPRPSPPRPCLSIVRPADCDTPYTVDEGGHKHYKPECL